MHQYSRPPAIDPKGNTKFEILFLKIFRLKQKINQILSATIKKINFLSERKQSMVLLGKGL